MDDINRKDVKQNVFPSAKSSPVGIAQKEKPPINSKVVSEVSAVIVESERKPGIEPVDEQVPLTKDHKGIKIQPAGESVPVSTQPSGFAQFPMTEQEIQENIKTTSNSDSRHWLYVL